MCNLSLDLSNIDLPEGWRRLRKNLDGEPISILIAEDGAGTLCLPLDGSGRKEIHLGMYVRPKERNFAMQYKLESKRFWRSVRPMRLIDDTKEAVQNGCLGVHEIQSGDRLLIRTEPVSHAGIAWVKLVEPNALPEPKWQKRNVGVVFDTNMVMSCFRIEEPDDLLAVMAPYIESDFTHIFWGTGVGTYSPLYFSGALGWHGQEQKGFMEDHRQRTAGVMRMFAEKKIDPLQLVCDFAHENGLELWANDRVSKNHEHDFRDDFQGGRFLLEHQDKRVRMFSGDFHDQVTMSFAYPEIREMKLRCLLEQARYNVDGLYIDFIRKAPIVGWEQPVVEAFKTKTGHDPYNEPSSDWKPDWFKHISEYVTDFMRELRRELDALEKETGRRIPVAVQVYGSWRSTDGIPSSMFNGLDPVTWAKEGLIDILAPKGESDCLWTSEQSLDRFHPLLEGTGCKIWGPLGNQSRELHRTTKEKAELGSEHADLDPWRLMRSACDFYNQGADGVYIWEAHELPSIPQRWEVLSHLGDRQRLNEVFSPLIGAFDASHRIEQEEVSDE